MYKPPHFILIVPFLFPFSMHIYFPILQYRLQRISGEQKEPNQIFHKFCSMISKVHAFVKARHGFALLPY